MVTPFPEPLASPPTAEGAPDDGAVVKATSTAIQSPDGVVAHWAVDPVPSTSDCHSAAYEEADSEKVDQSGVGWATTEDGLVVSMPTRKSPAWGVIDVVTGAVVAPWLAELASTPAIPETSATTM